MNQIISYAYEEDYNRKEKIHKKNVFLFWCNLFFSFSILIFSFSFYFIYNYNLAKNDSIAKQLTNSFNISKLYYTDENVEPEKVVLDNTYSTNTNIFSVIGIIQIDKIEISYHIISETSDELLKIAPCRFYGPNPNEVGNLCIAGHNYSDNRFFGKLNKLNNGDEITIYDSYGNSLDYVVYKKYEVHENDTSCTSQNTNGRKEITLITCNNFNNKRIIVKAVEKAIH